MNKDFYFNKVRKLMGELYQIENKIDINSLDTPGSLSSKKIESIMGNYKTTVLGFQEYYELYNGLIVNWKLKEGEESGCIKILKLDKIFIDGKDMVYFDHTPEDSVLRDFYIVDFFVDEACVGIYANHPELPGIHYFDFENQTYPLHVDFEGYMKLLGETKGFLYWQKVILDHLSGSESYETKNFKEIMPSLFPDFDYDKFIELYESVRIDK